MNEAVDKVIEQRERLDGGFPAGMVLSAGAHLLVFGAAVLSAWLTAAPPTRAAPIGFAVPLPRGGGGPLLEAPAAAPAPAPKAAEPAPPAPAPPPKVIKPPKEEPKKGLPKPDARKTRPRATPTPRPAPASRDAQGTSAGSGTAARGAVSSQTPGLGIVGPAGPGSPDGTDPFGDWYLAGVQRKIWLNWMRGVRTGFTQPMTVSLTILADGSLEANSVRVTQSSGVALLDLAAQRAVLSAQPFGPLPKNYGTNRITIQALFQPTP